MPMRTAALLTFSTMLATQVWAAEPVTLESVVVRLIDEANAPARDAGVVVEILVREGQSVKKGDLLARLDNSQQQLAEQAAQIDLKIAKEKASNDVSVRYAKKAYQAAQAELRRSEESIAQFPKSVSQSQLDVERLSVERTRLEHEQAALDQKLDALEVKRREAELDARRIENQRRLITAPIDGVVVEVATQLGEWLQPGEKAMRVVDTKRLKAEGFLPADAATPGLVGSEVRVTLPSGDNATALQGMLRFVSPEVDPINNEVRVWAEIANRNGALRPGQRPTMTITPAASTNHQETRQP